VTETWIDILYWNDTVSRLDRVISRRLCLLLFLGLYVFRSSVILDPDVYILQFNGCCLHACLYLCIGCHIYMLAFIKRL